MSTTDAADPTSAVPAGGAHLIAHARAYCGPAHGRSWTIDDCTHLPDRVELTTRGATRCYRLVRDPHTRRPAHDREGNVLYLPECYGAAPSAVGPEHAPAAPALPARVARVPRVDP